MLRAGGKFLREISIRKFQEKESVFSLTLHIVKKREFINKAILNLALLSMRLFVFLIGAILLCACGGNKAGKVCDACEG